jgi:hypothetical protein
MSKSHHGSDSVSQGTVTGSAEPGGGHGGGHGGHGLQGLGDVFSFTLTAGAVTAASVTLPSGTVALPLTTGVSYSVSGSDVLATHSDSSATEVLRYSDTDADGLYQVISQSQVFTAAPLVNSLGFSMREALSVTLNTTGVTAVSQTLWDGTQKVLLSATVVPTDTNWTISNGLLVETHTNAASGQTHWEVFRDGNADGVYTEVAAGNGALIDLVGVTSLTNAVASLL